MTLAFFLFIFCMIAGLACLGGFLWSAMEGKPRPIWLIGTGAAVIVGLAGLVVSKV